MNKYIKLLCFVNVSILSFAASAEKDEVPTIEEFAYASVVSDVKVSPDGKRIAIQRATTRIGDYIIEVLPIDDLSAEPKRFGAERMELQSFSWVNKDKLLVSFRQNIQDGNRNYWVSKVAIVNADGSGGWRIPFQRDNAAYFSILSILPDDPDHILLNYDINKNYIPDVVKYNVNNGSTKTILRGNNTVSGGFVADVNGEIRAASGVEDGGTSINSFVRTSADDDWKLVKTITPDNRETFAVLGFSNSNPNHVYVRAHNGENYESIYLYDIESGEFLEKLFGIEGYDAGSVITSSKNGEKGRLVGFTYTQAKPERYFVDEYEGALYKSIQALFPKIHIAVTSRSLDDKQIVVRTSSSKNPGTFYLIKNGKELVKVGKVAPQFEEHELAKTRFIRYTARDGSKIPAYVTIPKIGKKPYPTIVMPHGGPWVRDVVIYDEWVQLLASRGFMVVQPQYRGSTGFGLEHWKAGDKQWGLLKQDDKDDAALWLVEKGLADKEQLAMFGWSYGGYAAFAASMRENNIYQCSIAGAGVSDLNRINATLNENRFLRYLQRPTIKGVSPLAQVEKVNIPIMVIHGDIDQRVPVEHSRLFVEQLEKHKKEHRYVELEGADHFSNTLYYDHKIEFYTEMVDFLENTCFADEKVASIN